MKYWFTVVKTIDEADVILLIADARMPEESVNSELLREVRYRGKKAFIVFNKIDLISKTDLDNLKDNYPDAFFVSAIKKIGIKELKTGLSKLKFIINDIEPRVGIIGYPNVGKSAIINALSGRAATKVSPLIGTTKRMQFITNQGYKIIDSPGVFSEEDNESKLGLISAKNPEMIRNKEKVAVEIILFALRKNRQAFEEFYKIKTIPGKFNAYDVFNQIGIKRGLLAKGGIVDENRTAVQIIRDWQRGKLKL
jgi:ribosome biogenesis GTPase A